MNRIAILIVTLFCASAFAQDLPKIAVYVTSKMFEHENKVLEKKMAAALVRIGQYSVVDRSTESSDKLAAEHIKQRDGSVDEKQIKMLGKQYGVDFICIADITSAFGGFQVSASIINVETAMVVSMGETFSKSMTFGDLSRSLDEVLERMFNNQIMAAPKPEAAAAPGQILMKPKYENTKMYQSEHLGAYGAPDMIGPNDVLTVLHTEKNYYKVRTASGKEGFVMRKDVINNNTLFVDVRQDARPKKQTSTAATEAKIFILTRPAKADIYIGKRFVGISSEGKLQVPVGTHQVKFIKNGIEKTETMTFQAGDNPTKVVVLWETTAEMPLPKVPRSRRAKEPGTSLATTQTPPATVESVDSWGWGAVHFTGDYIDFTGGQRFGTWASNWFIPGLGSAVIMQDGVGAATQITLTIGGYVCLLNGVDTYTAEPNALLYIGMGAILSSSIYNIARSMTYKKKIPRNTAYLENTGLNFAVLPDQDGNIKGYVAYRMEF